MTVVIDASAALYLFASADGLEPLADHDLVAPALLWSEVTSVVNESRWRREMSDELARVTLGRLLSARIHRRSSADLYEEAVAVAHELGWAKTYDAEYVGLARLSAAPLLTRDERLRRGASRLVDIVAPDEIAP